MKFKYRLDKTSRIVTPAVAGALLLAGGLLWRLSPGEYLPVWFVSIATAAVALALLSAPRSIRITDDAVEIRCAVEITHIPYHHIRSAKRIDRKDIKSLIPVFASPGFFGWFGYFLDFRNWDLVKIYATTRNELVEIEDIYEQRFVVSADDPDRLCEAIATHMAENTAAHATGNRNDGTQSK